VRLGQGRQFCWQGLHQTDVGFTVTERRSFEKRGLVPSANIAQSGWKRMWFLKFEHDMKLTVCVASCGSDLKSEISASPWSFIELTAPDPVVHGCYSSFVTKYLFIWQGA